MPFYKDHPEYTFGIVWEIAMIVLLYTMPVVESNYHSLTNDRYYHRLSLTLLSESASPSIENVP